MNIFKRALRSVLWRSGIGRKTAEKFWKVKKDGPDMKYLYHKDGRVLWDLPMDFEEETYNRFLHSDLDGWEIRHQTEYLLQINDVLVEPERCLGTTGLNELIDQTVVFKADFQYPYILPHLLNRGKAKFLKEAVLYDGSATRNFYHHLVETVGRLSLLSKGNLPKDIPIIVNRFVYDNPFFQNLMKRSAYFRSFNWYVQEKNDWLRVGKLYRPKALFFGKENWDFTRKLYDLKEVKPFRKVFLSRDKKRFTRGLTNEADVYEMMRKYGFEIVYAEHMSIDDQVTLFQETEYLVALTGMGLVQQFFMNYDKAHVIEIIPVNRLMPEYYCQAYSLGIKYYDVVLGEDVDNVPITHSHHKRYENLKEYVVDLKKLERAVARMLEAPGDKKVYGRHYVHFDKVNGAPKV